MKEKLRTFLYGVGIFLLELALLYPARLLDDQIVWLVRLQFGHEASWIGWLLRVTLWILAVALPLLAFVSWRYWSEKRKRAARLKACINEAAVPAKVRLAGRNEWRDVRPDLLISLVVPDAIAVLDKTHGLLRLKAISHYQDAAIELRDVIGVEWQDGANRGRSGRQSLFRRFRSKYRTLAEHPRIRLEIATKGKDPVLEYFLVAAPKDRAILNDLFKTLERGARYARGSDAVTTMQLLDALPLQGSRHDYAWI